MAYRARHMALREAERLALEDSTHRLPDDIQEPDEAGARWVEGGVSETGERFRYYLTTNEAKLGPDGCPECNAGKCVQQVRDYGFRDDAGDPVLVTLHGISQTME